jgi:cell division initiation protein
MDRIMPIDLERVELRKSFRGYETSSVDQLIKGSAESLHFLLKENASLREENERQRQDLDRTRLGENTLKDALILAQKAADETRAAAHQHGENIIEEARQAATTERMSLQQQISEMRWDLERLRSEKKHFEAEFKSMLDRYQRDLTVVPILSVFDGEAKAAEA